MPDLGFDVDSAAAIPFAATPVMGFKLRLSDGVQAEQIHTVALRAQIQIESTRRQYNDEERARLLDLFGEPDRWGSTLRTMLWTHANVVVPQFSGGTVVDLPVPCTFDFNVAATKYFFALSEGDLPLSFQFSGTVFYENTDTGMLQVAPIPWSKEARFRLPVRAWRDLMDHYYPNTAWLALRRDAFDRLYQYKMRSGIPTWEEALERLLPNAAGVPS